MACAELLSKHAEAWQAGVSHSFLEDCRDGVIAEGKFNTWLVQVRCHWGSQVPRERGQGTCSLRASKAGQLSAKAAILQDRILPGEW